MEPSKWPEVLRGGKKDRQKNLKLVKEILNTDICLITPCSKSIADHLEFWVDWYPRWDLGGDQKAPHQPAPPTSPPLTPGWLLSSWNLHLELWAPVHSVRLTLTEQMNWLNVYPLTSLNTDFCFSVCRVTLSTEMENWILFQKYRWSPLFIV